MRWRPRIDRRSLAFRLTTGASLALLAVLVVAAALAYLLTQQRPDLFDAIELKHDVTTIQRNLVFDADGHLQAVRLKPKLATFYAVLQNDAIYRIVGGDGRVVLASDAIYEPLLPDGARTAPANAVFGIDLHHVRFDVATRQVDTPAGSYIVEVARSKRYYQILLHEKLGQSGWVGVMTVLVCMVSFAAVVAIQFRKLLAPIRQASEAASRIEPNNLASRLDMRAVPSELSPLITAFNQALERIETGYRVQREFLAAAAHELKTPLALMRGQIELDGTADRAMLLKDIDLMSRHVQQLLHLAEVSERQNFAFEPLAFAEVATEVFDHMQRLAQQCKVSLVLDSPEQAMLITADRGALFVLLKNLLENAIQHSEPGASVVVIGLADGFTVRDRGPGIDSADLPKLFQRFWRRRSRRDQGAGLGLAICLEIATVHGWSLTARNCSPGAAFCVSYGAASPDRLDA